MCVILDASISRTAGAMSTPPPSSRWSRASHRARGSVRGGSRGRPTPRQSGRSASSSASRENGSQTSSNPNSDPREHHNSIWNGNASPNRNNAQLSSAILSHAGPVSMPKDQAWRNAAEQDSASYKQRMSDLYQKVCTFTRLTLTFEDGIVTFEFA